MTLVLDVDRLPEDAGGAALLTDVPLLGISRIFALSVESPGAGAACLNFTHERTRPSTFGDQDKSSDSDSAAGTKMNSDHLRSVALCIVGQVRSAASPNAAIPAAINRNIIQAIADGNDGLVHLFFVLGEPAHGSSFPCPGGDWICSNDDFIRRFPLHLIRGVRVVNTSAEYFWGYGDETECELGYKHTRNISPQYIGWEHCADLIAAAETRLRVNYSWVIRWRPDFRPDAPFPALSDDFWSLRAIARGLYVPIVRNQQPTFWHHVSQAWMALRFTNL